jgi:hypothetical protein
VPTDNLQQQPFDAHIDTRLRRKFRIFESQYRQGSENLSHKYNVIVSKGQSGDQLSQSSVGKIPQKELQKLSRNMLFDRGSFEDMKKFSN